MATQTTFFTLRFMKVQQNRTRDRGETEQECRVQEGHP